MITLKSIATSIFGSFLLFSFVARAQEADAAQPALLDAKPIIMISYPTAADDEVFARLEAAYGEVQWPQSFPAGCEQERKAEAFRLMLLKSAYYVEEVITAFRNQFPDANVLVQPGKFVAGEDGAIEYRVPNEELPAFARVDFLAHYFGCPSKSSPSIGSTHGKFFVPAFAVAVVDDGSLGKFASSGRYRLVANTDGLGFRSTILEDVQPTILGKMLLMEEYNLQMGVAEPIDQKRREIKTKFWDLAVEVDQPGPLVTDIIDKKLDGVFKFLKAFDAPKLFASDAERLVQVYPTLFEGLEANNRADLLSTLIVAETEFMQVSAVVPTMSFRQTDLGSSIRGLLKAERDLHKEARGATWGAMLGSIAAGAVAQNQTSAMLTAMQIGQSSSQAIEEMWAGFDNNLSQIKSEQVDLVVEIGGQAYEVKATTLEEFRSEVVKLIKS